MKTGLDDTEWIDMVQDRDKWKYCERGGAAPWLYLVILLDCLCWRQNVPPSGKLQWCHYLAVNLRHTAHYSNFCHC
jgi:hypothetical protein